MSVYVFLNLMSFVLINSVLQDDTLNSSLDEKEVNRLVVSPEKYIVNRDETRAAQHGEIRERKKLIFGGTRFRSRGDALSEWVSVPSWGVSFGVRIARREGDRWVDVVCFADNSALHRMSNRKPCPPHAVERFKTQPIDSLRYKTRNTTWMHYPACRNDSNGVSQFA
jgi:hypothetical protein